MDVVYAIAEKWVTETILTHRGEIWPADHPIVKAHPQAFTTDPTPFVRSDGWTAPVEAATAAPGEKRATRRTRGFDVA